ncbi:hypothetical protein PUN28_001149 [Cardiocondyla obscurior]|uniref:Uncharacterized protein n=1 Tax=Cardiocondyla obscurior TaxID=286306 RepID=A0AAW2H3B8_9HYME
MSDIPGSHRAEVKCLYACNEPYTLPMRPQLDRISVVEHLLGRRDVNQELGTCRLLPSSRRKPNLQRRPRPFQRSTSFQRYEDLRLPSGSHPEVSPAAWTVDSRGAGEYANVVHERIPGTRARTAKGRLAKSLNLSSMCAGGDGS